jgi:hypothetical protein
VQDFHELEQITEKNTYAETEQTTKTYWLLKIFQQFVGFVSSDHNEIILAYEFPLPSAFVTIRSLALPLDDIVAYSFQIIK